MYTFVRGRVHVDVQYRYSSVSKAYERTEAVCMVSVVEVTIDFPRLVSIEAFFSDGVTDGVKEGVRE